MCAVEKQESGLPSEGSALELRIAASLPNLHQLRLRRRRRHRHRLQILRVAPVIQNPHLLHAGNRAPRRAKFFREIFAVPHLGRVLRQRNPRISALLRAPMHQSVLANVQIPRARSASPVVLPPARHVVLEFIESRKRPLPQLHDLFKNFLLARSQRLQLPVVVVNNSHCARESQLHGPPRRICRIPSSSTGCISGSPPLMVIIEGPMSASKSSRFFISGSGTGFEKSSNSLQYVQARLHCRIGMMCTRMGCFVEASAFPIIRNSRARVRANRSPRRSRVLTLARTTFVPSAMNNAGSPQKSIHDRGSPRLSRCLTRAIARYPSPT